MNKNERRDDIANMSSGYILLTCEHGFQKIVMKKLLDFKQVREVSVLEGMYDMIVKIEEDSPEKLRKFVIWKIRKLDKIRSIMTLVGREKINYIIN